MPNVIISTTQKHLDIETISHDLVFLKDGSAALILQVSAINFGLLSEEEQDATIYAYASLLNSLSFPIQITVRSVKKDISQYLSLLEKQEKSLKDPTLKQRMFSYRQFVEKITVEQNVLEKKFYVTIPYTPISLVKKVKINQELIKRALTDLEPKRDHLIKQFNRIGLSARQLNSKSLIKLFSSFYNPQEKGINYAYPEDYQAQIVAPNLADQPSNSKETS